MKDKSPSTSGTDGNEPATGLDRDGYGDTSLSVHGANNSTSSEIMMSDVLSNLEE